MLLTWMQIKHDVSQLNAVLDAAQVEKALLTQLTLDTREVFLQYQHNSDAIADVTFNLKDFKQMLSLCESLSASVAIRFDQPGSPLVVEPLFRDPSVRPLQLPCGAPIFLLQKTVVLNEPPSHIIALDME